MSQNLDQLLLESGLVDPAQLREAQAFQRNRGRGLAEALTELGLVDEPSLFRLVAKAARMPFVDLSAGKLPARLVDRIPPEFALEQRLAPVAEKGGKLVVAVDDPDRRLVADQLRFLTGTEVVVAIAAPTGLGMAIERHYGGEAAEAGVAAGLSEAGGEEEGDAPIIRLVSRMFQEALDRRSSDIHIEPEGDGLVVRYRVDGVLREVARHPGHLAGPLVSRLKIMGKMDIAEKRKPQDGRIGVKLGDRDVDVRISVLPTNHGESIVMRLLDRGANLLSLRDLGLVGEAQRRMGGLLKRSGGIVLVTGPTGSGKTVSLYTGLNILNTADRNISTAEDPAEINLPGINQVNVNPKVGLTFASALKAFLRQDPDIIMVGEIRDLETAEIAIKAAQTGHLVLSTLHTNDAPQTLTRMLNMGVPAYNIASSVSLIIAQRLARRLCKQCKQPIDIPREELIKEGFLESDLENLTLYEAKGCDACSGTGYKGRVGIYQVMPVNEDMGRAIMEGSNAMELAQLAKQQGIDDLRRSGLLKVLQGVTSLVEVNRVTVD